MANSTEKTEKTRFWQHRFIRIPMLIAICAAATTVVVLIGIAAYFDHQAKQFDMAKVGQLSEGSIVKDRSGEELGRVFVQGMIPVRTAELPEHFVQALLATEDARFFGHSGYDFEAVVRAALANSRAGRIRQGGSTITMQLARKVFELESRTIARKLTEVFIARRIEKVYSKAEILDSYLNRIYFGGGATGLGAAAERYFGKTAAELTLVESALICGIIKRPSGFSPYSDPAAAKRARNLTLERMMDLDFIDVITCAKLQRKPVRVRNANRNEDLQEHFRGQVEQEAARILEQRGLSTEGHTIHTTIDIKLQKVACQAVQDSLSITESQPGYAHLTYDQFHEDPDHTPGDQPDYLQAAVVVIDNWTGSIRAAVGGRDHHDSQFNRLWHARRPPGTAFLPIIYGAAFEKPGFSPRTLVLDAPLNNRQVMIGGQSGIVGEWGADEPENRYEGEITAALAFLRGKNAATVRTGSEAGLTEVLNLSRAMGIESALRDYPSTFLGSSEVTLLELTQAFATIANQGRATPQPSLVGRIAAPNGGLAFTQDSSSPSLALSVKSAEQLTTLLRNGAPLAGQSGTTHGHTDAWYIGFNRDVTCGVWVGFDRPRQIAKNARGSLVAKPIWNAVMDSFGEDAQFEAESIASVEDSIRICLHSGDLAGPDCGDLACSLPMARTLGSEIPFCSRHCDSEKETVRARLLGESTRPIAAKSAVVVGDDPFRRSSPQ